MRTTPTTALPRLALGLLIAATLAGPCPAVAADHCGQGASAAQDTADIRGVRAAIGVACPCTSFDGSSATKNKGAFLRCAKTVIDDASDGTPIDGRYTMRKKCKGTVLKIAR